MATDNHYRYMPTGEAVVLHALQRIQCVLIEMKGPQPLQCRMLHGVSHEAGPARRKCEIPGIRNEKCHHYQKRAITKLLAGPAIPVQYPETDHRRYEHEIHQLQELGKKRILQSVEPKDRVDLPHGRVPARPG